MVDAKNIENNATEIINNHIGGFYKVRLNEPMHLEYASESYCNMTGYSVKEVNKLFYGKKTGYIHPQDVEKYMALIHNLSEKQQSFSTEYRLIKKDGSIINVFETMTSKSDSDGNMWGISTITEISDEIIDNIRSDLFHEIVPCGIVRFATIEDSIEIISMNQDMKFILGVQSNDPKKMEYLNNDMKQMLPQGRVNEFIQHIYEVNKTKKTINFETCIINADGQEIAAMGWINKISDANDDDSYDEYTATFIDVTPRVQKEVRDRSVELIKTISYMYDGVFEMNLYDKTLKCIKDQSGRVMEQLNGLRVFLLDAIEYIIKDIVYEEDRNNVFKYIMGAIETVENGTFDSEVEIEFRTDLNGIDKVFNGKMICLDNTLVYFCCTDVSEKKKIQLLEKENRRLRRENEIVKGIIKNTKYNLLDIEVKDNKVRPLNYTKGVTSFLGTDDDFYLHCSKNGVEIKDFFENAKITYTQARKLITKGEVEYEDNSADYDGKKRAMILNTEYNNDGSKIFTIQYNIKPNDKRLVESIIRKQNVVDCKNDIYIRTFGYFDIFVNDKPIYFKSKKAKELLAIIVDRRGGYVSAEEAISYLWEDESKNKLSLARHRKVAMRLRDTLRQYGIEDIIVASDGKRRIDTGLVRCDLYDYLSNKVEYGKLFNGSYMVNYSWGEYTLAELQNSAFAYNEKYN